MARIIFFGNERIATGVTTDVITLRRLLDSNHKVMAVLSNNASSNNSRKTRPLEIAQVCKDHGIGLLLPSKPSDVLQDLRNFNPDIGVLVAYGKIVPQSVIDIFPNGIVNIHPSLLPEHRGPTPIESSILTGQTKTGVSLMKLEAAMDAGPVFMQQEKTIDTDISKQDLADSLLELGSAMLINNLDAIISGKLKPKKQNASQVTYDSLITKKDGYIDWHKSAEDIAREVRAYLGWPRSNAVLFGKRVIVTRAHVVNLSGEPGKTETSGKELVVFCKDKALSIDQLIPAGKKEMSGTSFIVGFSGGN